MRRRRNPDPQYGAIFATARQDFLDFIVNSKINTSKQIVPPVRVTVVGPAFFDAQHRGAKGSGNPTGYDVWCVPHLLCSGNPRD